MMKNSKPDEKQKRVYSKIDRKIKRIKSKARKNNKDEPHIQIKSATDELRKLYYSDEVRLNQGYLLQRYIQLEKREVVWEKIFLPIFGAFFSAEQMILMFELSIRDIIAIVREINSIKLFTLGESTIILFGLAIIGIIFFIFVISIIELCKILLASLTRNIDSTIKENEIKIISAILLLHGVFLDEDKECHLAESYFVKK